MLNSDGRSCDGNMFLINRIFIIIKLIHIIMYTDIDECSDGLHTCDQLCNNTVGSYYCSCLAGYRLLSDDITCQSKFTH